MDALLPMYAIGVFIGFTLAQTGMVIRWLRLRTQGWQTSLTFNALGALATGLVVLIIAVSKFDNGDVISPYFHFGPLPPALRRLARADAGADPGRPVPEDPPALHGDGAGTVAGIGASRRRHPAMSSWFWSRACTGASSMPSTTPA